MSDPQGTHPRRSIADHGVIGNLHTIALVASDGAIDFLCWPQIDSPTVFSALLDPENGGEFSIEPQLDGARIMQDNIPDTNMLLTRWLSKSGSAELVDFMPRPDVSDEGCVIVRRLRVTRGKVGFLIKCKPRLDYARSVPVATLMDEAVIFQGAPTLRLRDREGGRSKKAQPRSPSTSIAVKNAGSF
jgi:GH15 family glucan-1,4-alpha-glucosidase